MQARGGNQPIAVFREYGPRSSRSLTRGVQPTSHFRARCESSALEDRLAATKDHEIRNRLNAETGSEIRIGLGIHLEHYRPTLHFARELLNLRSGHLTRSAPVGPKVHQDGHLRCVDDF